MMLRFVKKTDFLRQWALSCERGEEVLIFFVGECEIKINIYHKNDIFK